MIMGVVLATMQKFYERWLYGEMHRFILAWMATKVSAKIDELVVDHHPRIAENQNM